MKSRSAIDLALEVYRFPSLIALVRAQALPADINLILRIAVGDAGDRAAVQTGEPEDHADLPDAIEFYIQQVLLHPDADEYRILGAEVNAPREILRANMALLVLWLHPDRNQEEDRTVYMARVLDAWDKVNRNAQQNVAKNQKLASDKPIDRRYPDPRSAQDGTGISEIAALEQNLSASVMGRHNRHGGRRRQARTPGPLRQLRSGEQPRLRSRTFVWIRRLALIIFALSVVVFLIAPGEMLLIVEDAWARLLEWL